MKTKPPLSIRDDIKFLSMFRLAASIPMVATTLGAAGASISGQRSGLVVTVTVAACVFAAVFLATTYTLRRARQALLRAQIEEAFDRCAMERLNRLERVLNGWEKGVVPERDWHAMTGGKPLPEHLRK
jgi:hypothetical protein